MIFIDWVRHAESCSNLEHEDLIEIEHDIGFDKEIVITESPSRSSSSGSVVSIDSIESDSSESTNKVIQD